MLKLRKADYLTHTLNFCCIFAYSITQLLQLRCTIREQIRVQAIGTREAEWP